MADQIANPFSAEAIARRYVAGRPDYGPAAAPILARLLGDDPAEHALDIGCGTGISMGALRRYAKVLVGIDASIAMLRAGRHAGPVVVAAAERLCFRDAAFDLVGIGSALHWFDPALFLPELRRVTTRTARLIVHDHWFTGVMPENPDFANWIRDSYLPLLPPPVRHRHYRPPDDLDDWGHRAWERYEHDVTWSVPQLVAYLMTQSNTEHALRGGREEQELTEWITGAVALLYGEREVARLRFGGYVAVLQRKGIAQPAT